ncbi:MAG TPA: hypothetical protein VK599_01665 [Streptosporangiaceae bacterium]|nr:hypothetical protein [Streptosporangiaceae bacterium]
MSSDTRCCRERAFRFPPCDQQGSCLHPPPRGTRLFDGVDASGMALEPVRAEPSPRVTHLTYAVRKR